MIISNVRDIQYSKRETSVVTADRSRGIIEGMHGVDRADLGGLTHCRIGGDCDPTRQQTASLTITTHRNSRLSSKLFIRKSEPLRAFKITGNNLIHPVVIKFYWCITFLPVASYLRNVSRLYFFIRIKA